MIAKACTALTHCDDEIDKYEDAEILVVQHRIVKSELEAEMQP